MKKRFELQNEIVQMNKQYIVDDNKDVLMMIDIKEIELNELNQKISAMSGDFWEGKAMLEKHLQIQIDLHKVSVKEYFSYFKTLK
jgi:hypothetical protein